MSGVELSFDSGAVEKELGAEIHEQVVGEVSRLSKDHEGDVPLYLIMKFPGASVRMRSRNIKLNVTNDVLQALADLKPIFSELKYLKS